MKHHFPKSPDGAGKRGEVMTSKSNLPFPWCVLSSVWKARHLELSWVPWWLIEQLRLVDK